MSYYRRGGSLAPRPGDRGPVATARGRYTVAAGAAVLQISLDRESRHRRRPPSRRAATANSQLVPANTWSPRAADVRRRLEFNVHFRHKCGRPYQNRCTASNLPRNQTCPTATRGKSGTYQSTAAVDLTACAAHDLRCCNRCDGRRSALTHNSDELLITHRRTWRSEARWMFQRRLFVCLSTR